MAPERTVAQWHDQGLFSKKMEYGKRWAVETSSADSKRTMGSKLTSRKPEQLLAEGRFQVAGLHPQTVGEAQFIWIFSTEP